MNEDMIIDEASMEVDNTIEALNQSTYSNPPLNEASNPMIMDMDPSISFDPPFNYFKNENIIANNLDDINCIPK